MSAAVFTPVPRAASEASPAATDRTLFLRYAAGHMDAREALAKRHMPMAQRLAKRHRVSSQPQEDLEQVAYVGLLKAIDRFDVARGSFLSFAIPNIRGELKRHFRDRTWDLQVPRPVQENYLLVKGAVDELGLALRRSPTPREIATHTGLSLEQVIEALDARHAYSAGELEAPRRHDDEGDGGTVGDTVGKEDPGYGRVETKQMLGPALKTLPERQQQIVHMRFVEDLHQREIAEVIGISQMHVSRQLRAALEALAASVRDEDLPLAS